MCDGSTDVVATPDWWWAERAVPENGIHIDSCIADTIEEAWRRGVRTAGSCCGHGRVRPSVVLVTHLADQPELARAVFADIDPERNWLIEQWQLVDVSEPPVLS